MVVSTQTEVVKKVAMPVAAQQEIVAVDSSVSMDQTSSCVVKESEAEVTRMHPINISSRWHILPKTRT